MTWGRENGDPQWEPINTFDKMNARLRDAYVPMNCSPNGLALFFLYLTYTPDFYSVRL